jgi:type II secretion system protein G
MRAKRRKSGFTLIEVLIVVVIMAVLAATVIPQFSESTSEAKLSTLKFNLHTLRAQIQLYKAQHGNYPEAGKLVDQLTKKTTTAGAITGSATDLKWGPYIVGTLPVEPFSELSTVVDGTTSNDAGGWVYDAATGTLKANKNAYFSH